MTTPDTQTRRLPASQKYAFGIGAIGKDAICNLVGAFLMLYMTDTLGLSAAFAGVLLGAARIWDAVNDPMMGMIVDNTHTRYGKFRIWLIIGTLINSVFFILLFTTCGITDKGTLMVYVSVMYILYGMTYTIMDVPYWSWLPNLSSDPRERESISVVPRIFASIGGFLVCTFGLNLINYFNEMAGDQTVMQTQDNGQVLNISVTGFTYAAVAIVVLFIVCIGITCAVVKEKPTVGEGKAEKTSLKEAFAIIIKNDQLVAFIGLLLTFNLCTQILKAFAVYYFKEACGNAYLYSIFGYAIIAEMVGLFLFPKIAKNMEREKVYLLACALPVVGPGAAVRPGLCGSLQHRRCHRLLRLHLLRLRPLPGHHHLLHRRRHRLRRAEIRQAERVRHLLRPDLPDEGRLRRGRHPHRRGPGRHRLQSRGLRRSVRRHHHGHPLPHVRRAHRPGHPQLPDLQDPVQAEGRAP